MLKNIHYNYYKMSETFKFEAHMSQLMSIIINAFYSNKEVFLRELISNSSDALNKVKFNSINGDPSILAAETKMEIRIVCDKTNKKFVIEDTGIGMTKEELINNLGTIARSGTKEFIEQLNQTNDTTDLIGKFGVGFYSSFLVGDVVEVISKPANQMAHKWVSNAGGEYTITECPDFVEMNRGTRIIIHTKDSCLNYLDGAEVKKIIEKHSGYVAYPIYLLTEKTREVDAPCSENHEDPKYDDPTELPEHLEHPECDDPTEHPEHPECGDATEGLSSNEFSEEDMPKSEENDDIKIEEVTEDLPELEENCEPITNTNQPIVEDMPTEPKVEEASDSCCDDDCNDDHHDHAKGHSKVHGDDKKKVTEKYTEYEHINTFPPIWRKNKDDITPEEYKTFYKNFTGDYKDAILWNHFKIEGQLNFTSLIYIPEANMMDAWMGGEKKKPCFKLYVRRVFITDDCKDLLPTYLEFVRGLIDSDQVELNVSREMLQKSAMLTSMKKFIIKKILETIKNCKDDNPELYKKFYTMYGRNLKQGIHEDDKNRDKLAELLLFNSKDHPNESDKISLTQYVENMKPDQKAIYYITGESVAQTAKSPFMEYINKKGWDILFLTEPIDGYCITSIKKFENRDLMDVSKEDFKVNDEDKDNTDSTMYEEFFKHIIKVVGSEQLEKVVLSSRLVESPCALSTTKTGYSATMEKLMSYQPLGNTEMMKYMKSKRIFELNPNHLIFNKLYERYMMDKELPYVTNTIQLLYQTAELTSGFVLDNPAKHAKSVYDMLEVN